MRPDISTVPRPEWSRLPYEGCVGVEGKVLVREDDFFIAMLRFLPHATIHEHPGLNDTLVVCIQGEGLTSVAGETAPLRTSERAYWPANVPHCLWTEDTTMTTLMIERPGVGFPARGSPSSRAEAPSLNSRQWNVRFPSPSGRAAPSG